MIAYRCQYEPNNREVLRMVRKAAFGPARLMDAVNVQNQGDGAQWRFRRALAGGGSLLDVGLYCLNAACFLTGEESAKMFARSLSLPGDPRYAEVEETVNFMLRFTSGLVAIAHRDGRAESVDERRIPMQNQFALEMDHMADCVLTNREPGQPVALPRVEGLERTRGPAPSPS